MSWAYIQFEYPVSYVFHKELVWANKDFNTYFAFKLNDSDDWTFYAGNNSNVLDTGLKLTSYGNSESSAQEKYLITSRSSAGKILAVLPAIIQAKYARIYIETGDNVTLYEWRPSIYVSAHEIISGSLEITDLLSDAPLIKVVSGAVDRLKIGNFESTFFGIAGYDDSANKIFELSDNDAMIAGWKFDKDKIYSADERIKIGNFESTYLGIVGYDALANKMFEVSNNAGLIAGWSFDKDKLYSADGRIKLGNFESTYFGLVGYDALANKVFEISDNIGLVAGWNFDKDKIYKTGSISIDSSSGKIEFTGMEIDGVEKRIQTTNFVSGPLGKGWRIDTSGAEFQNIYARGKLSCVVFEKDVVSSVGGKVLISNSDILDEDMDSEEIIQDEYDVSLAWGGGASVPYSTFESSGANITSAINTTSGYVEKWSSVFAATYGATYIVRINLTLNSGQAPTFCYGVNDPWVGWTGSVQLVEGVNEFSWTCRTSIGTDVFAIYNTLNCNWSATFEIVRDGAYNLIPSWRDDVYTYDEFYWSGRQYVTDGDFNTVTGYWTGNNSNISRVTGGVDEGWCLSLEWTSSGGYAYQVISGLVVGETYKISIRVKAGTIAVGSVFDIGFTDAAITVWETESPYNSTVTAEWVKHTMYVKPSATSIAVILQTNSANVGTILFDKCFVTWAGKNLLENGEFETSPTEWLTQNCTLASVAGGKRNNCLQMTGTGGGIAYAYQKLGLVVGKKYQIAVWVKDGTDAAESVYIGVTTDDSFDTWATEVHGNTNSGWTMCGILEFTAVSAIQRFCLLKNSSNTGTTLWDIASVFLTEVNEVQAIESGSGTVITNSGYFPTILDEAYRIDINLRSASGQLPYLSYAINAENTGFRFTAQLADGMNSFVFVSEITREWEYLLLYNTLASNWSADIDVYRLSDAPTVMRISGDASFEVDEILQINDGENNELFQVEKIDNTSIYIVERDLAAYYPAVKPAWQKGTAVVSKASVDKGFIALDASSTNSPVIQIFKRTAIGWDQIQELLRIGNLNGFLGYSSALYGFAVGDDGSYLTYDPTNGLIIKGTIDASSIEGSTITGSLIRSAETGRRIEISEDGIACITGATTGKYGTFKYGDGTKYGTGIQLWINNPDLDIPIYELSAGVKASMHFVNRGSAPSGAATIGDLAVISTLLNICQADGSPSTAWYPMYPVRGTPATGNVIKWNAGGYAEWVAP